MKTALRLIIVTALVLLSVSAVFAQTKDVVQLKNGSVIKGTILEMIPDKTIKIQTADGNIFVYNMTEVEKISKDASAPVIETKPMNERSSMEGQRSYEGQSSSEGSGAKFSIFGGVALPMGDFGKKYDENATAEDNAKKGEAKLGWTAGAQFVTGGTVGWIIEGSYSQNKIQLPANIPYGNYSYTGWTSILALTGIKIGTDNSSGTNFFVAPLVGALFAKSPQIDFTQAGSTTSMPLLESRSATGFAYGANVEVILGGHVTLGAKYVASKPKFKWSEPLYTGGPSQDYEFEQNVSLLLISLGVAF
ncbi:MAG: hypothetical protein EHM64_01270 [Ignavibacteriae bacterium]|nr:MAG: hypothetical protein EHM64_01270 [Ignavibacteriota bacterium]